ncbi:MAG: hypothetical protein CMM44_03725 [Rhodospirillaceae bacterium]|nr:hypothetical protein [Rhodospirillaceae bacterium]
MFYKLTYYNKGPLKLTMKQIYRKQKRLFQFLLIILVVLSAGARAENRPVLQIKKFHLNLLHTMKTANNLGLQGRYKNLRELVQEVFDLKGMVKLISGNHWRKAKLIEQKNLVEAFRNYSAANYALRFNSFSGQKFITLSNTLGPSGSRVITTQIVNKRSKPIQIAYVLLETNGVWRVIDIILAGGISELATRRSEYRKILTTGGTKALTIVLNSKTRRLLAAN